MSYRSSFVTEYIYCAKCFAAVREALAGDHGGWIGPVCSPVRADGETLPIVAGKVSEHAARTEHLLLAALTPSICHPVRVVVLQEGDPTPVVVTWLPPDYSGK